MSNKGKRGFASLSKERRTEIARHGGLKAQKNGTAHKWNSETARAAGLKSGKRRRNEED